MASKDIYIISIGRILIAVTGVVAIRLLTTFLSPAEVGRMNIILAVCGWMNLVVMNPLCLYVSRKLVDWNISGTAARHLFGWLKSVLAVSLLSLLVAFVLNPYLGIGLSYGWLVLLIGSYVAFTYMFSSIGFINILKRRFWFVLLNNLGLWIGLVLSVVLVLHFGRTAQLWLLGQIIGFAVISLVGVIVLFRIINKDKQPRIAEDSFSAGVLFQFIWPLSIVAFLFWCQSQGYRFIFQRMSGLDTLGLFVVGFGIGSSIMLAFDAVFNQYYHPIFYNEIANAPKQQRAFAWNKYISVFLPAVILMAIYIASNGNFLTKVLTGDRFHGIGFIVSCGAIAEGLRMIVTAVSMVSHSELEMRPLIFPSIIGTFSTLAGIMIFVSYNAFVGAGLSIVFGWLVNLFFLYSNMKKLLLIKFPYKRVSYAFLFSLPLLLAMVALRGFISSLTVPAGLVFLAVTGVYMLIGQFLFARKWLYLPVKLKIIDDIEAKINSVHNKIYGTMQN